MDCEWSKFEPSTPCSVTCGSGQQIFTRKKILHQHVPTLCDPPYDYQHLGYNKRSASQYHQPHQPCSAINHVGKECYGEPTRTDICSLYPCKGMYKVALLIRSPYFRDSTVVINKNVYTPSEYFKN